MPVEAWAAFAAREPLGPFRYDPPALGALEVDIDITHCGICHSDLHLIDNDWGFSTYPLVPGHEIVGTISAVGAAIKHLRIGQRVGVGWQCGSCLQCPYCLRGKENLCASAQPTCVGRPGGFAKSIRVDSRFAFAIPASLDSATAGPLLCGGLTVFSPLRANVTPLMRVGVIGIGGLGHLALQFARAFGCDVTAFSSTPGKEQDARRFGAHHFVASSDSSALTKLASSLDFLLASPNVELDWNTYLDVLQPEGKLCIVGGSPKPIRLSPFPLILGQRTVCGSVIGGRPTMLEMLNFAVRHGIKPQVELLPMSEANAAIDKVRNNQARYRIVLANQ